MLVREVKRCFQPLAGWQLLFRAPVGFGVLGSRPVVDVHVRYSNRMFDCLDGWLVWLEGSGTLSLGDL